jgi:hypothetical protein
VFGLPLEEERKGGEISVEEKDRDSKKEEDEILDQQVSPFLHSGGIGGETTAV